jgi:hypothetical protein
MARACNPSGIMRTPTAPRPRARAGLPGGSVHGRVAAAMLVLGFVFLLGVLRGS